LTPTNQIYPSRELAVVEMPTVLIGWAERDENTLFKNTHCQSYLNPINWSCIFFLHGVSFDKFDKKNFTCKAACMPKISADS